MPWNNNPTPTDTSTDLLRKILIALNALTISMPLNNTTAPPTLVQVPSTDHSGSTTAANVSQTVVPANLSRQYFLFVNNSSKDLWINFGSAATLSQPSIKVAPNGGNYEMNGPVVITDSINVIGNAINLYFTAKEA